MMYNSDDIKDIILKSRCVISAFINDDICVADNHGLYISILQLKKALELNVDVQATDECQAMVSVLSAKLEAFAYLFDDITIDDSYYGIKGEWVFRNIINDNIVSKDTTWSSYKIQQAVDSSGKADVAYVDAKTTPGQGLTKDTQDRLTLDLESKQLVAPSISTTWTLFKIDGTTPYTPDTSNSKSLTVDRGVKANVSATFRYPTPTANQANPSTISGDWGTADPGPNTDSVVMNNGGNQIADDKTFSATLSKPKSGLVVSNNQVQFPSGNDTTSDSISIAFRLRMHWGTIAKNGTSQPILDSDILDLSSEFRTNRLKSFTNFGGGGKRIIIVTQRGTGGDNWGECSFRVNGLANTAFTKVRSASAFVNAAGYSAPVDVWLSNSEYNSPLDSFEVI